VIRRHVRMVATVSLMACLVVFGACVLDLTQDQAVVMVRSVSLP
jgi:hypothetical protein